MPEALLAQELDRALTGEEAGDEARELAALLVAAAQPARFEVAHDEVEQALTRVRPPRRVPRRPRLVLAFAAAVLLAAAGALFMRTPSDDVEAKAARALDRTYYVVEQVRPAQSRLFRPTEITGLVSPTRGLGHWRVFDGSTLVAETRVQGERVTRYDARSNTLTIAESCHALASGCAEVLDPVELYRRTLGSGTTAARQHGNEWRLTLRGGARVEQVVTLDGKTYLPTRIEWRDDGRPVSTIRIVTLEREPGARPEDFALDAHPGARVRYVAASGEPVRVQSARAIEVPSGALWLGPSYRGYPARAEEVRFNAGTAVRITYGPIAVWNYDRFVPPALAAAQGTLAKIATLESGAVARIYFGSTGALVADIEVDGRRAGVVSAAAGKEDVVRASELVRKAP
jgi:hypothetical protein